MANIIRSWGMKDSVESNIIKILEGMYNFCFNYSLPLYICYVLIYMLCLLKMLCLFVAKLAYHFFKWI